MVLLNKQSKMESTKNVKGNRKIVVAKYYQYEYFKIPDNLDLNDKSVVEYYSVKWGTLYIKYVGIEKLEEIKPFDENTCDDLKRPNNLLIEDAEDDDYEDDENADN